MTEILTTDLVVARRTTADHTAIRCARCGCAASEFTLAVRLTGHAGPDQCFCSPACYLDARRSSDQDSRSAIATTPA